MVNMIQSPENFVNDLTTVRLNPESSSPGRVQIVASDAPARSALNYRPDYIVMPLVVAIDFTKGATPCCLTSFLVSLLRLLCFGHIYVGTKSIVAMMSLEPDGLESP